MRFFRDLSLGAKVAASFAVVGVASAVAGLGTFATFTSSTAASNTVATGTAVIALGATGASTNRLNINASEVAAGDTIQRSVDLLNTGSTIDLASIVLDTTAAPSSLLDTDGTDGLQMVIQACSVPWTESGLPYTYTCSGTTTSVLTTQAVIGASIALSNLTALTAGVTDHLRIKLTLPATAGNTLGAHLDDYLHLHRHPARGDGQVTR